MQRLRRFRNRKAPDLSLRFLTEQFRRDVDRPYRQLAGIAELWAQHVPAELAAHTRLERFSRGVLHVGVDDSAHLYELDRTLRSGLRERLVTACRHASLRRIQLRVCPPEYPPDDPPVRTARSRA